MAMPAEIFVLAFGCALLMLHIALQGLRGGDEMMRGISLEYFESILPPEIRGPLWPYLEDHYAPEDRVRRPREEILMELLQSQKSMELNIEALKQIYEEG